VLGTLLVFVADSSTGKPVGHVDVSLRRPGWYVSDTHQEPEWFSFTDSTGWARLRKVPAGIYEASLCENSHERKTLNVEVPHQRRDTLRFRLLYQGPPGDGRRCETRFFFPKRMFKKGKARVR